MMASALVFAALLAAGSTTVMPVSAGNALTLPAARHLVRLDPKNGRPATWLLAVEQEGAGGHWLSFWRSDDEARSWTWYAPIDDRCCERNTADLIAVGMDVAVVYSYESWTVSGSLNHKVHFQWWRWDGNGNWHPWPAVTVFDPGSSNMAWLRAEIARDSLGRLWVWAQRLNPDGTFTMGISVSTDGGSSWRAQPMLDTFRDRPGGRIMPVAGNKLMLLYGTHGVDPGYMRLRSDGDPLASWSARQTVFPEGIYHGAALSAAGDGNGGVHLAYKDVNAQLYYRHWNGAWSDRHLIESRPDWALQPALTRVDGAVVLFWNRVIALNTNYQLYYRIIDGNGIGPPQVLDGSGGFKGYPAAAELLPSTVPSIPCFYGKTPDANTGGSVALVFAPTPNATTPPPSPPPPPPPPPAPDGGVPVPGGTLFSDNFDRTIRSGLGPSWEMTAANWLDDGKRAVSGYNGISNQASVAGLSCADCSVQARVINFAATTAALSLRENNRNDRYDVALTRTGRLQIRRHNGSAITVLGDVASGVTELGWWVTIGLSASGSAPVHLIASVNGTPLLSATDSSASALSGPGTAGLWTDLAGVWFDDFVVTANATSGSPGGGAPDTGTPDAGTPDAGTPDAGTPDAGPPNAGSHLTLQVTHQSNDYDLLAVDRSGTAYAISLHDGGSRIYASADGRSWTPRGAALGMFWTMTALPDGTLLADVQEGSSHVLSRSIDRGASWTNVLTTGSYRTLSPHSFAELDGAVYYIEYQGFTISSTPIRLWKSTDSGATWSVQHTFQGHRHGHGLMPDPSRHALFAFFGDFDAQSGLYRSTDGGASWTLIKGGTQAGDIVDGVVLPDGSFLCGQDISYQGSVPNLPQVAHIALDGTETDYLTLPSASYSTHALAGGGYVVGATHEEGADVEVPGYTNGSLWGSADGVRWAQLLTVQQATVGADVRADVYWELRSGELVLNVRNAAGFSPDGRGYLLLQPIRR